MSMKLSQSVLSTDRRSPLVRLSFGLVALSLGLVFACAGELPPELKGTTGTGGMSGGTGGEGGPKGCAEAEGILKSKCAACHTSPLKTLGSLDLISAGVSGRLVGVSTSADEMCAGKGKLLDAGTSPATGIFIQKIKGTQTCGTAMPPGGSLLPNADIACLQDWADGLVAGGN